jgi:hypothetical protein
MKVESFELRSIPINTQSIQDISYKLIINGLEIPSNLPSVEYEDDLLQIDVCEECLTIGCSSMGYVQVITANEIVIWKEPLFDDKNEHAIYQNAFALSEGTFFWPLNIYQQLMKLYNIQFNPVKFELSSGDLKKHGYDMWRIYGSKKFESETNDSLEINFLEEYFLTFEADNHTDEECWEIYKNAKRNWNISSSARLIQIPEGAKKISVIFDKVTSFTEWDILYFTNEFIYYPIGDGFAIKLYN